MKAKWVSIVFILKTPTCTKLIEFGTSKKTNLLLHLIFPICINFEIHCGLSPARSFSPVISLQSTDNGPIILFNYFEWYDFIEAVTKISSNFYEPVTKISTSLTSINLIQLNTVSPSSFPHWNMRPSDKQYLRNSK